MSAGAIGYRRNVSSGPHSPYRIVTLDARQEAVFEAVMDEIDEACFPGTRADEILDGREAKIVAETLAIGGSC